MYPLFLSVGNAPRPVRGPVTESSFRDWPFT